MVDVHSHIAYGVDDGAETIDQALDMIKEAEEAGFKKIIATPHYIQNYYENDKDIINQIVSDMNSKLYDNDGCSVKILQGNEIYFTKDIIELIEMDKATTLAESRYVLFELPLNSEVMNLNQVVYQILENGKIPVLAHPERYPFVQNDPNVLIPLIESGVLIQCNYGSILGQYHEGARKTIRKMLEHNMVHLLGSDAHRRGGAYALVPQALNEIEKIIGQDRLEIITTINPEKIIHDEYIEIEEATPIKKSFFEKLKN